MWWIVGGLIYLILLTFCWCALILAARSDRMVERQLRVIEGSKQ